MNTEPTLDRDAVDEILAAIRDAGVTPATKSGATRPQRVDSEWRTALLGEPAGYAFAATVNRRLTVKRDGTQRRTIHPGAFRRIMDECEAEARRVDVLRRTVDYCARCDSTGMTATVERSYVDPVGMRAAYRTCERCGGFLRYRGTAAPREVRVAEADADASRAPVRDVDRALRIRDEAAGRMRAVNEAIGRALGPDAEITTAARWDQLAHGELIALVDQYGHAGMMDRTSDVDSWVRRLMEPASA